jgi:DNA-binding GntR family transcriptional regulator
MAAALVGRPGQPTTARPVIYTSKTEMVAATLRELILTGTVPAGTALRQRDVAERLNVSPTPVREAFRILESEGLLAGDVHRGFTVLEAEQGEAEEVAQIRVALETLAASLAAERISPIELSELKEINKRLIELDGDHAASAELNRNFHFAIFRAARSPLLSSLMRLLWRSLPDGRPAVRAANRSVADHNKLIAALQARNAEQASGLMKDHILRSTAHRPQRKRPA